MERHNCPHEAGDTVVLMQHKPPRVIDRPAVRPALRHGAPIMWIDGTTLQIGVRPKLVLEHSTAAEAMSTARFLSDLDGSRAWSELLEHDELLMRLVQRGLIDDASAPAPASTATSRERASAEIAALGLRASTPSAPHDVMRQRFNTTISVRGDGRLGTHIAVLLAASGIGRVLISPEPGGNGRALVSDYDIGMWSRTSDIGVNRVLAARSAIERSALAAGARTPTALTIVARDCLTAEPWIDPESCSDLVSARQPHLLAAVAGTRGRMGPFVNEGSPCQRCYGLHQSDADPAWPMVAAHLIRPRRTGAVPPVAAVAVAQTAAMTAHSALAFVDEGIAPEGTVELDGWNVTVTPLAVHPDCGCSWRLSDLRVG